MVQGIVHAGDHAGLVSKRGVQGDIFNPFPINPDLPLVTQTFKILSTSHWTINIFPLRVPTHLIVFAHITYTPKAVGCTIVPHNYLCLKYEFQRAKISKSLMIAEVSG